MQPLIIVTAADANYFELVQGTILSIREKPEGQAVVLGFLDLGCTPQQIQWLQQWVDLIKQPQWEFEFPQRSQVPAYFKGLMARPFLRQVFPGFEVYCWVDADAWVQDWQAIALFLKGAQRRGLAIAPELDRGNKLLYGYMDQCWSNYYHWYQAAFGEAIAQKFHTYPMLNAGVFAMHYTAPHWEPWAEHLQKAAQTFSSLMADQIALNFVIYASNLFERTELLPAWCNWTCHFGMPVWNQTQQCLVEPYLPHTPIGILHLTTTKHKRIKLAALEGGLVEVNVRYSPQNATTLLAEAIASPQPNPPQPNPEIEQWLQQAAAAGQAGQLATAEDLCRRAIQHQPENARGWHLLGLSLFQAGRTEEARTALEQAIALDETSAEFHNHLGAVLCSLGDFTQGIHSYRRALVLQPQLAEAHFNLALALTRQQHYREAIAHYQQVIALQPQNARAYFNLASTLQAQGQNQQAIALYRKVLELQPTPEVWQRLGLIQQALGDLNSAAQCYRQALVLNPNFAEAHNNLGTVLHEQGNAQAAIAQYQRVLQLQPGQRHALINLANLFLRLERFAEAEATYRQLLQDDPNSILALDGLVKLLRQTCQWSDLEALSDRLIQQVQQRIDQGNPTEMMPLNTLLLPLSAQQQQAIARDYARHIQHSVADYPPFRFAPQSGDRLRLGYVSGDFRDHPVAHLMLQLFGLHDRNQFEVIAYSLGPEDGSLYRQQLMQDCDRFVDLSAQTPIASAQKIYADQIDILIDLAGYTEYSLPQLFALRPAPIQVNYLGYPGTMGAAFIDYLITDSVLTPPELADCMTEQCVYLPHSYQINDNQQAIAPPPSRLAAGLPASGMVYCCFNNPRKIEPQLFSVWMRILSQVPNSVLWLFQSYPQVEQNLRHEAEQRGVAGDRLIFAPRSPKAAHLSRLQCADLILDTQFYNAHTTASDALWAGIPLITTMGQTFASRVAASLLTAVGLPELITPDLKAYEQLAVHLGQQPQALQQLREKLQAKRQRAPLYNTEQSVRDLEQAYRQMWQQYRAGHPAQTIRVAGTRDPLS